MANVGQRGSGESKKCTGKLLLMPPSENQQRSNFLSSSFARLKSIACKGTALNNNGKLKLIRTATAIGMSQGSGNGW